MPPGEAIADTRGVITTYESIVAAEFVGTAVLILIGPGSAILAGEAIGTLGIALAFGFALLLMAYVIGPISGCHINPAITLGFLLTNKIPLRHALWAWAAQIAGGIFGAAVIFGIASGRDGWERGGFASNGWDRDGFSGLGAAIIVEIVFTALFVDRRAVDDEPQVRARVRRRRRRHHAGRHPPGDDPGRQHERQPGTQPGHRDSSPTPTRAPSASSGCSSSSRCWDR